MRLSAVEFEALRPLLRISAQRVEAARMAMVDGLTLQAVADRYGWSKNSVYDAMRVVWEQHTRYVAAKKIEAEMLQAKSTPASDGGQA